MKDVIGINTKYCLTQIAFETSINHSSSRVKSEIPSFLR